MKTLAAGSSTAIPFDRSPIVPFQGTLIDGRSVSVAADGAVRISTVRGKRSVTLDRRMLTTAQRSAFRAGAAPFDRQRALFELAQPRPAAYAKHSLIVVFKDGTTIPTDQLVVPAATVRAMRGVRAGRTMTSIAPPRYTNDERVNALFAKFAVSRADRLFSNVARGTLSQHASRAASRARVPVLNLGNAFRITVTNAQLSTALTELRKATTVAYVGRDYRASSMAVSGGVVAASNVNEARSMQPRRAFGRAVAAARSGRAVMSLSGPASAALDNFMVTSGGQAFLNAPGVDAIAAFDEIAQNFPGQLPGAGVTITNVSLGDLDDASAATNTTDPCHAFVTAYGPTTRMIGGQRYLDLPSMPLIPAYVASPSGTLSGSGEVCGMDPFLQEIGLDFAVMAPLPHAQQRAGEAGAGLSDLLGIAPGAAYRLVVPAANDNPSLLGALLGAATQSPAPDIITMSIGYAYDRFGFPGRYFDDDALARSVATTITNSFNIPLFIAANDGTRAGVGAAIGPSGGSAPTNVAAPGAPFTTLDDVGLTTVPSTIPDSGSIDVGGTTLDDVYSANPQDPANAALASAHAFPETRFNGFAAFSSGFGSRVNVSAPSDSIFALVHFGPNYDSALPNLSGGTSASAPEAAAVAAIAIQVARLQGHPFASPAALRTFLAVTGTTPAQSAVSDIPLNVGPQVSARRAVEALLAAAHVAVPPSVARVAIMQRKTTCEEYEQCRPTGLLEYVDPAIVSLRLPQLTDNTYSGARTNDYLTIAPDWEGLPPNAAYRLTVAGKPNAVLATSPFARLLPAQILAAAGLPLASTGTRTVSLTYQSTVGLHVVTQTTFDITFGPADGTSTTMLAPVVPPVVTGSTIPVAYDFTTLAPRFRTPLPYLTMYIPSRFDGFSRIIYSQPLPNAKGTIAVPVSALAGAGVYIVSIRYGGPNPAHNPAFFSTNAYTRVVPSGIARPPAPLLGVGSDAPGHALEVPYAQPISIAWDASAVPHASGAVLEVSFGAPNFFGSYNAFDNPNGSELDVNGVDSPSAYHQPLSGVSGTTTLDARKLNLFPGVLHSVRILATNGGSIVGEASDASALVMDGVAPPDGGTVYTHSLNTAGSDGLLVSVQEGCVNSAFNIFGNVSVGSVAGSNVMTFDQSTLKITNPAVVAPAASCNSQPMVFGNDLGLYYDRDARAFATIAGLSSASPSTQYFAFPAAAVPNDIVLAGSTISPLPGMQEALFMDSQEYVGGDSSSTKASFFGLNSYGAGTLNEATAFSTDLLSGAPGPVMTIHDFEPWGFPVVLGTAYDPNANVAYSAVSDDFNGDQPATIVGTDYSAGTYSLIPTVGLGPGRGFQGRNVLVLDPGSKKLLFVNDSELGGIPTQFHIIDLQTKAVTLVTPPIYSPYAVLTNVLCDPVNHLFIMIEQQKADDQADEHNPSGVDFFDESGTLVKHVTIPYTFFPYNGGLGPGEQLAFVNGSLRRLFIAAPPDLAGTYEPQLMAIDY